MSDPITLDGPLSEIAQELGMYSPRHVPLKTEIHRGVQGITVSLIDRPMRPYRTIFDMTTSTWTSGTEKIDKWDQYSPEARYKVVTSALSFKVLPNAMEAMNFVFGIEGVTRAGFDQIVRGRIGQVFVSMGTRDCNHSDVAVRIKERTYEDAEKSGDPIKLDSVIVQAQEAKATYHSLVEAGMSWQDARDVLPQSIEHRFSAGYSLMALRAFMARRLKACEQEDVVAVAWLMRERVREVFPLFADFMVPSCDTAGRCNFHDQDAGSILFRGCGRWPDTDTDKPAINEHSCTEYAWLERDLPVQLPDGPSAKARLAEVQRSFDKLDPIDQARFQGEG